MKGISNILAHGGQSEETTGIECDLDFDSVTTGTAFRVNMPNSSTGAKFLRLRSGTSLTERLSIGFGGGLTIVASGVTITAGGFAITAGGQTISAGGLTISAGGLNTTGNAQFNTGVSTNKVNADVELGGSDLRSGISLFDRVPRFMEYLEDFTNPGAYLGSGNSRPLLWTQTTGTTSPAAVIDGDPFGIMKLSGASCNADGARANAALQHKNEFIKFVHGKRYYFETRVAVGNKLGKGSYYIGLTNADTDLFDGVRSAPSCTDFIGFSKFPGSLKWHFVMGTAAAADKHSATSTPNVHTGVSGTYVRLGFKVDCTGTTTATPYINGVAGAAPTQLTSQSGTSIPGATALTWSAGVSSGAAGGNTMKIDYVNVILQR